MSAKSRKIKVYWLQFIVGAFWVGVIEVLLYSRFHPDIRRFLVDVLIVLTGILAFEPISQHILKYFLISFGASILIQGLRKLGHWYITKGPDFWGIGGPIVALSIITVIVYIIGLAFNKDKVKL